MERVITFCMETPFGDYFPVEYRYTGTTRLRIVELYFRMKVKAAYPKDTIVDTRIEASRYPNKIPS